MTSKLQALADTVRRKVYLVDVEHVIARLNGLALQQKERGQICRANGVLSAIELIRRDLAKQSQ